jgi:hypothetical protein
MIICVYVRMSCVNGCVVALDWYLPRTFGVSEAGVLMHALGLFDGGVSGAGVTGCYWRECAVDGQVGIGVEI